MKVSAKTEYACLAMLALAAGYGGVEPLRIREIAAAHDIPSRFLVQILLQLKGAGLVNSTRGAAGGDQLARSPAEISLADIVNALEGQDERSAPVVGPESAAGRVLRECWREVADAERDILESLTLSELRARTRKESEMYYI